MVTGEVSSCKKKKEKKENWCASTRNKSFSLRKMKQRYVLSSCVVRIIQKLSREEMRGSVQKEMILCGNMTVELK